jgi:hypothetical protein
MLTATVVVGAVLLMGCGSDDGDDTSAGDAPATEESVPAEPAEDETDPPAEDESLDETSAGDVDACAIAATLDVEGLLGEAPAPQDDATSEMGAVCVVKAADTESRGSMRLVVETKKGPENYEQQKELLGVDSEPTGFGEQAFHTGPYLFVLEGDTLAFIQVLRDSSKGLAVEDAKLEEAMTLVMEALAS